ncbi:Mmc protein [Metarhizium album ARSEF 1941]|uniref:Mmc protein n=1 Tax=Metarhizium album (strain ARSEF 1941) TaxID=1081103 RepID=A0A0B2WLS2_METAS|nr:Mmc protein [Metarhizium album ARSEF 1941]KHN97006.1 Mmc protein [Metarhizium album ARSEF 1941]
MKYTAALVAAAVGANAFSNVTYVTEVVSAYTTYCPAPTEITHGTQTYTVTAVRIPKHPRASSEGAESGISYLTSHKTHGHSPTTLTITNCPCTVVKPVTTTPAVVCTTCTASAPVNFPNTTVASPTGGVVPTKSGDVVPTAGAGKAAALSGAGLAGVVGLAAFIL